MSSPEVTQKQIDQLIILRNQKMTQEEISKTTGLSRNQINRIIKLKNLPLYFYPLSEEELEFLKENFYKLGVIKCCEVLNIATTRLYTGVKKLGLTIERKDKWTASEDEYLHSHYFKDGPTKCSEALGRKCPSVNARAFRLKLSFDKAGENNSKWKGYKELSKTYFSSIINSAIHRGLSFDLQLQQIWDLFIKQNRRCALSGELILLGINGKRQTASLDRIDSSKGYTIDNVQWVHKSINKMKMDISDEQFINWCHKVSAFRKPTPSNTRTPSPSSISPM